MSALFQNINQIKYLFNIYINYLLIHTLQEPLSYQNMGKKEDEYQFDGKSLNNVQKQKIIKKIGSIINQSQKVICTKSNFHQSINRQKRSFNNLKSIASVVIHGQPLVQALFNQEKQTPRYTSDDILEAAASGEKNKQSQYHMIISLSKNQNPSEKEIHDQNRQRINKQMQIFQKQHTPQSLYFQVDKLNSFIKQYEFIDNKTLRKKASDAHLNINHDKPLPQKGILYFKVKIKTLSNSIFLGLCVKQLVSVRNSYTKKGFMCWNMSRGQIFVDQTVSKVTQPIKNVDGKELKVQFDMNKKTIEWFIQNKSQFVWKIPEDLLNRQLYPIVSVYNEKDIVQFIKN